MRVGVRGVGVVVLCGTLLVGCGGGGDAESPPQAPPAASADTADDAVAGGGAAPSGSTAGLTAGECPLDAATVSDAVGATMSEDDAAECVFRGPDGVELVTARVQGGAEFIDGRAMYENQGFAVVDIDRGDEGVVATRELEAVAEVEFGELILSITISGFGVDADGWRDLGLALVDAATDG